MTAQPQPSAARPADDGPACAICGDAAVEAEVLEPRDGGAALVCAEGYELEIATDLVGPVAPGDRVLVHLGFAIARIGAP